MQETIIILIALGYIIYTANLVETQEQPQPNLIRIPLIVATIMVILLGVQTFQAAMFPTEATQGTFGRISVMGAVSLLVLSIGFGGFSLLVIASSRIRQYIKMGLARSDDKERRYSPQSWVHTTAIVLACIQIINSVLGFLLAGGIEGLAESYSESGLSIFEPLSNLLIYILVSLLGVGLFIRRDLQQTLRRLGIERSTGHFLLIGAGAGFILFWFQVSITGAWSAIVSPDSLAEQTSAAQAIFDAYSQSFALALILAISTGIGEELLFRGALQPIFGNVLTSLFFASIHTQYLLTPAIIVIFIVSLGFGWLRSRYNTTAAMMAHFVYNFMGFVIFFLIQTADIPIETFIP